MLKGKISTEAYKGARDFYPEELATQKFIFNAMRNAAERFGYEEYSASLLEPTELFTVKSGEEIIKEQTYTFEDRGGRSVTLRPEMTPSLARMVAKKRRELAFPLRWFSIPNLFRYERPQKGRLREHWQLNADIFGVAGIEAEVELISLGYQIMKNLGATEKDFTIKINYAGMLAKAVCEAIDEKDEEKINKTIKIIDRFGKIPEEDFNKRLDDTLGEEKAKLFIEKRDNGELTTIIKNNPDFQICLELKNKLNKIGIDIELAPFLTRGFDYYTGIIFEFFDTASENNRALFGGGRYDELLAIFGEEKIPAVGFGMGDVTAKDFLQARDLLPSYNSTTQIYVCVLDALYLDDALELARVLREDGVKVAVDYSGKKIGAQIAVADKKAIPFVVCVGEREVQTKKFKLKNLKTGEETELSPQEFKDFF